MTAQEDALYTNVIFKNLNRKNMTSNVQPSEETTYSEVKIGRVHSDRPSEEPAGSKDGSPASQQPVGSKVKVKSGCDPKTVAIGFLGFLLVAMVITLILIYMENIQIKAELRNLNSTHGMKENHTDMKPSTNSCQGIEEADRCFMCDSDWQLYAGKCYNLSTTKLTWKESRASCQQQGGDLVKIETRNEQDFLNKKVQERMEADKDKFWIGMTDSVEEAKWLWVDGSPLKDSFWMAPEPDNWEEENKDGEDCARMGEKKITFPNTWFDVSCIQPHKGICEKDMTYGYLK